MKVKVRTIRIGAGALLAAVIGVLVMSSGEEEAKSERAIDRPADPAVPPPLSSSPLTHRPPGHKTATDYSTPVDALALLNQKRLPPMPRDQPYRPAKLLAYSELEVAHFPDGDENSPTFLRIIKILQPNPTQLEQIRALWKVHEDGRRALWNSAYDRKSGPRVLSPGEQSQLDAAFESVLVDKVLTPQQGVDLLVQTGRAQP